MGQARTEPKTAAARRNGALGGRPFTTCQHGHTAPKILRRKGKRVVRQCHICLKAEINPGQLNSKWPRWYPEKWKDFELEGRPLAQYPAAELARRQCDYYRNEPDQQAALDAAVLFGLNTVIDAVSRRLSVAEISEMKKQSTPKA
jgi:hypothetical protein